MKTCATPLKINNTMEISGAGRARSDINKRAQRESLIYPSLEFFVYFSSGGQQLQRKFSERAIL